MPSPFPGMDPYLENPAFWPDFHERFITYWCDALADVLPPNYEARIAERVYLLEPADEGKKLIGPDVAVSFGDGPSSSAAAPSSIATLEPVTIPVEIVDEPREACIKILHRPDRKLVTILELLSPRNKTEQGRAVYLLERNPVFYQAVHLVELDFLLGGRRLPLKKPLPAGDYFALIYRSDRRPDCNVYAWTVRQPLPPIPIPLKAPDPDVRIDLNAVLTVAYERGRYARVLDYKAAPSVPLSGETLDWITQQAKSRNLL
jgi:hypothetical protein